MEFTCLGLGRDQGEWDGPSCHLLQASGVHILLECPLDMSMLQQFWPASSAISKRQGPSIVHGNNKLKKHGSNNNAVNDVNLRLSEDTSVMAASNLVDYPPLKEVSGHFFLDVEPWYKTAEFGLVDVSSIDVVLISNPEGMLGLPFFTRMKGFSAKIYATSVTAKLGQLMMEELVSVHAEYIRSFGNSDQLPSWLAPDTIEMFPKDMKKALVDDDGIGRPNWHKLYRKKDIESCMQKVQCLNYDEEISIYDMLIVKPCSSGYELGSSNWVISGMKRLSYFSASQLVSAHAMCLNAASHVSSDILLFCDLKASNRQEEPHKGSENASCSSGMDNKLNKGTETVGVDSVDHLKPLCEAALNAVKLGGSVLITISTIGTSLAILEGISETFSSSNLGHIPIFFLSSVGEEILVYTNTIPEWVSTPRQEKLYAGEALFGHVELLQQKRMHQLTAFHSTNSVKLWKEPCIVFAMDWGFRMGSTVQLLHRWRQDSRCLLILTKPLKNVEQTLIPFMPLKMKILQYSKDSKLCGAETTAIIEKLKPELALVPETMKSEFQLPDVQNVQFYNLWGVLSIPAPARVEVDMSTDLACKFRPKQLDSGLALGRMMMSLKQKDSKWILEPPTSAQVRNASFSLRPRDDIFWGSVGVADLVNILMSRGLVCEVRHDDAAGDSNYSIVISSPSPGKVDLMQNRTFIETNDPVVRGLVTDAVYSLLHVV